jgi:hypothetical protein
MGTEIATRRLTAEERRIVRGVLGALPYLRQGLRIEAGEGLGRRGLHAATFVPRQRIVVDRALLKKQRELRRILYHELFHLVWTRLGNPLRRSYDELLRREWREGARGELGWSAERVKLELRAADVRRQTQRWRDYCCESFCDSAAWFCLRGRSGHAEWTLRPRFRERRRRWFTASDVLPRLTL